MATQSQARGLQPAQAPTDVPDGDGWVAGGLYIEGGVFPGSDQCYASPYTVDVIDKASRVVKSVTVPGLHSYAIVLPPGQYSLRAQCSVPAFFNVTAGQATTANTYCLVPLMGSAMGRGSPAPGG